MLQKKEKKKEKRKKKKKIEYVLMSYTPTCNKEIPHFNSNYNKLLLLIHLNIYYQNLSFHYLNTPFKQKC